MKKDWYINDIYSHSEYFTQDEIVNNILNSWMDSKEHRENMLASYWKSEGIGIAIGPNEMIYITENFC